MRTLREFLTKPKSVLERNTTNGRNTLNRKWPEVLGNITLWKEFNLQTLNDSYGHVLDAPILEDISNQESRGLDPNQLLSDVAIDKDNDINHMIGRNQAILEPAIEFGKSCLALHDGIVLKQESTTADKSSQAKFGQSPTFIVDHIIQLDSFPVQMLVVGIGKTSAKWNSNGVLNQRNENWMRPVRQLAEACRLANTRYGYIQTDKEIVVCCFKADSTSEYKVAIMPIPWSSYSEKVLTTDLTLWWLSMMALSGPENVALVPEDQVVPIDQWEDHLTFDEKLDVVYVKKHKYSRVLRPIQRDNEDVSMFDGTS